MKKLITLLLGLILLINGKIISQDMAVVQGKVLDEKSTQPVAFANVSVYIQKDSVLAGGAVTNDKGEFCINGLKPNTYCLKINYMGYQNKQIDKIELSGKTKLDVGSINLSPSEIALSEVSVVGDKLKGQEKVDRTVYAVPTSIKSVSSSGLDVLKHIPAVNVDLQENITLEGRSDIMFYVDGIQRDKDFVSQIDPAQIDRVEVISNPSARYGGDISGVIEIFLIKDKSYGISGRISADIPSPPTYIMSPGANIDFGYSNIRLYVSDRMHYEAFDAFQEANTTRYISGNTYKQQNIGEGNFNSLNNNLNFGMDLFINDKNTINLYGNYNYNDFKFTDFRFDSKQYINEQLDKRESIDQSQKNKGSSNYYSIYYKKKFNSPEQQLTLQSSFYDYRGGDEQTYLTRQLNIQTEEIENQYSREERIDNRRKSVDFMADYNQSFSQSSFESGIKSYYQWYNNTQPFVSDADNNFVFNEFRLAAYVNYTYKFEKISIQGGLRTELSKTEIENSSENNYICLLPQLSIIRQLKKSQNLKLNARRRIYRPGIDELNPFTVWSDSLHLERGNPNLNPSYSNDLEFVYSKNFNSSMISPKLYVKYVTGDFQSISVINSNGVIESFTQNIGKSWEYGLSLNFAIKLTKWWMINGYARVNDKIIYNIEDNSRMEKISYQTDFTSIMTFFKTWNFMMMANYRSPYITYQKTNYRDLLFLIGLEKEVFKNAKLHILYLPPYTKKFTFQRYETKTNDLVNSWKGGVNVDYMFSIQFSYSFKTGKKVKTLERSTDYDSDTNKSFF